MSDAPAAGPVAGLISKIARSNGRGEYEVFVDGEFAFGVDEETLVAFGLRVGKAVDPGEFREISLAASARKARICALRLLERRRRTVSETRRRLLERGFDEASVDKAVAWLIEYGFLDDREYAQDYVLFRAMKGPTGRLRVAAELERRGLDREVVREAVHLIDPEVERALARKAAASRLRSEPADRPDRARRRIASFLYRRGFSEETIERVVAELLPE